MDTIGELTGQVAHDFNNLLMAVWQPQRYWKELPDDPLCRRLLHMHPGAREAHAGQAAARLSRRKNSSRIGDIGELVAGMEECSGAPWGSA